MKKRIAIAAGTVFFLLLGCGIYLCTYYPAVDVEEYLTSTEAVQVTEVSEGLLFDGSSEDTALIFYPGAKVDIRAYAPILYMLAENGVDCFVVNMPFYMAFLGSNRAEEIMEEYPEYDTWYLGGHSLGGAMAANFAAEHTGELEGLFLLAAYPTKDLSESDLKAVTIYGSEDGILNRKKLEEGQELLPEDSVQICIEGGNHAQFGSYGAQKKDGKAEISPKEQWEQTLQGFRNLKNF